MLNHKLDFSSCAWKPGFVKSSHICTCIDAHIITYHIEQNDGEGKLWRIGSFKRLAGENFGELQ